MKKALFAALLVGAVAPGIAWLPACASSCQEVAVVSETSHGAYEYSSQNAGESPPSVQTGSFTAGSVTVSDGGETGWVQVSGSFEDASGTDHVFTLSLTGVVSGATVMLGSDSSACVDGATEGTSGVPCTPLVGFVGTSNYATDCDINGACALSIIGGLNATTTLPYSTLKLDLSLQHQDVLRTIACPMTTSTEDTEGS
jgi:hypothetical protein